MSFSWFGLWLFVCGSLFVLFCNFVLVCCLLFVVCGWLFVNGWLLLVVRCLLFDPLLSVVARCSLVDLGCDCLVVVRCLFFVFVVFLCVVCCWLFVEHYS